MVSKKNEKALVVAQGAEIAALAPDVHDRLAALRETLDGETLQFSDLEMVKTPTGGGKNWELPTGEAVQVLTGIPIMRQTPRAYWRAKYGSGEGSAPPDCSSPAMGGEGFGDNGTGGGVHDCATCPQAQYGTKLNDKGERTAGQACGVRPRIFLATGESVLPLVVSLAPTALRPIREFFIGQLGARGWMPHSRVINIGLEQSKSSGGIMFSRPTFAVERALDSNEFAQFEAYRQSILPVLTAMAKVVTDTEFRVVDEVPEE